ncbi:DUF3265 domain-containing protein [Vibrio vulnificus]|nr:DUF3265 domain-containing protein [Vibrio vulnificus]
MLFPEKRNPLKLKHNKRFALGSVIKSLCGSFCIACLHPLTRRYVHC